MLPAGRRGRVPAFDRLMLEFDEPAIKSLLVELDESGQAKASRRPIPRRLLDELVEDHEPKGDRAAASRTDRGAARGRAG